MENELRVVLGRRYMIDKGNIDTLAGLIGSLAAEQLKPPDECLKALIGEHSHLYHFYCVANNHLNIRLPADINYAKTKKAVMVIASRSGEESRKAEDYLSGMLYAKWSGDKNIVTYKRKPVSALLRVDVIMAGDEPLKLENDPISIDDIIKEFDEKLIDDSSIPERVKPIPKKNLKQAENEIKSLTPKDIYRQLSKEVYGQEEAKKSLSVILYQHHEQIKLCKKGKKVKKTNAVLIGPTGCGKTLLARTLADVCSLPFLKIDAINLVQRGYRGGMHIEQIPDLLKVPSKGSKKLAEQAVIFIDEIDKLAYRSCGEGDVSTQGVQQDLLALIDGGTVYFEDDHDDYERSAFNFCNVLFLFGGAFSSLNQDKLITQKELVRYGFMPEFANRLGNIIKLDPIDEELVKTLIRLEIAGYNDFLPMTPNEVNVYTEIIHAGIISSKGHLEMGGRCVGQAVRRFFEERIFDGNGKMEVKSNVKEEKSH